MVLSNEATLCWWLEKDRKRGFRVEKNAQKLSTALYEYILWIYHNGVTLKITLIQLKCVG